MTSPVPHSTALRGALLAIVLGAGCATDEPPQPPPAEDPPPDLVPEVVSSIEDLPVGTAVDDRYVYWITATLVPDPNGAPLHRGSIVRWDKSTGERVVLAKIEDTEAVELDVSSTYVYWIERGIELAPGEDRLLRIPKMGGTPQVIASVESFPSGGLPRDQVAIANGYVYWVSSVSGAIRRTTADGALTVVETIANNLDTPTNLAASSTKLCFQTATPAIWCMPAGGGAIDLIANDRLPYDMVFLDDRLYWSDAGHYPFGIVEHAAPYRGTTIETVPLSIAARELTTDATAVFWAVGGTPSGYRAVKGFVGDIHTTLRESYTSSLEAPASDGMHVYFIESERVVRVPARP